MASVAAGQGGDVERALFVRKATGLVRGWSVRDAFIYAAFSINIVTLGLYIFSYGPFIPDGSLLWSVLLAGGYLVLQGITYASLIAAMPRAGGDYVWISRVLGGGPGFVLAITGWWFILWLWVPIYANILNVEVLGPLCAIIGWDSAVTFWGGHDGVFVASIITALLASFFIALGIRTYARVQKICFYGGVIALAVVALLLLFHSKASFISHFNDQSRDLYGVDNAYAKTLKAGTDGYAPPAVGSFAVGATFLLIPMMAFFNLWSNWGATLYGEVRGASDFRKNIYAMGGALIATTITAVVLFLLFSKTFGWTWYNAANNAFWAGTIPTGVWPYPGLLAASFFGSPVLQFILVAVLSLWFFGWVGTVFLSSTRVIFAAAFDRVLPESVAGVSRNGVPMIALALMLIPSIGLSALYAYNSTFVTYTLDATLVIAVTFLGSAIAAAVLPWRKKEIYNASPIARYKVLGLPLITFAALAFIAFLVFCLYKWLFDDVYGVNKTSSLWFMAGLYALAVVIYVGSRIYRRSQGMDLSMVYGEIPAE
ncbi:MAG TPA: APC family permease [Solirubrobacteraceae bacterium]|jgi:amino acid transporter